VLSVGVGYSSLVVAGRRWSSLVVKDGRVFTQGDLDGVEHIIALDSNDGKLLWAVQPAPVVSLLNEKLAADMKRLDSNGDGTVSEVEALARFGWKWNSYNEPASDDASSNEELEAIAEQRGRPRCSSSSIRTTMVHCLTTKQELRIAIGGYRNGMGDGPRGTPTVDGNRIYAEGGNGDLVSLEAETGKTLWHVNPGTDFGGGRPGCGYSESPLIAGDLVIVTPGGKAGALLALNKENGEVVWQSSEYSEGAHYSSPTLANINGVEQVVQFARQSVFGVTLAEGKPLWRYTAPANGTANCCSPVIDGHLVFASSSYGTGGGLAKATRSGSIQVAEEVCSVTSAHARLTRRSRVPQKDGSYSRHVPNGKAPSVAQPGRRQNDSAQPRIRSA